MHGEFEVETGSARPGAWVVDVTGKALLAAIEIDGGDALTGFHQANADVQGSGRIPRTPLFMAEHDYMRRARLPLTSLQKHFWTPGDIFKLHATAVKLNAR